MSDEQPTREQAASAWLARRDRGLTPAEQDAFLQWLRDDPRHAAALAQLEKTWSRLDALAEWSPAHSSPPNPDLLVATPPRSRRWLVLFPAVAAAAAALVAVGIFVRQPATPPPMATPPSRAVHVVPAPERLTLADGSIVELNRDSRVETAFTPGERRVRLLRGEAHFTVAKNPARPFVVDAGAVAVRAVGTAFDVRRAADAVEVLVTEGKVNLEQPPATADGAPAATPLRAGERATVNTLAGAAPQIDRLAADEIERALAWQGAWLEFAELPLSAVVTEFNLRNRTQLVIGDPAVADVRVGGKFRADNLAGFVRLLDMSFGVAAEPHADGTIVLRRAK